jgi:hypothetical protein
MARPIDVRNGVKSGPPDAPTADGNGMSSASGVASKVITSGIDGG